MENYHYYKASSAKDTTLTFDMDASGVRIDALVCNGQCLAKSLLDILPACVLDELTAVFVNQLCKSLERLDNSEAHKVASNLLAAFLSAADVNKNWLSYPRGG